MANLKDLTAEERAIIFNATAINVLISMVSKLTGKSKTSVRNDVDMTTTFSIGIMANKQAWELVDEHRRIHRLTTFDAKKNI